MWRGLSGCRVRTPADLFLQRRRPRVPRSGDTARQGASAAGPSGGFQPQPDSTGFEPLVINSLDQESQEDWVGAHAAQAIDALVIASLWGRV